MSLTKDGNGFGINVGGAKNDAEGKKKGFGVFVKDVKPGSVAEAEPKIVGGLQILQVDDVDLRSEATVKTLGRVMKAAGPTISLQLAENSALCGAYLGAKAASKADIAAAAAAAAAAKVADGAADPGAPAAATTSAPPARISTNERGECRLTLTRGAEGLGIKFKEFPRGGIYISGFKRGVPAAEHPNLAVGMPVLAVGTANVARLSKAAVLELMAPLGGPMKDTPMPSTASQKAAFSDRKP